MYHTIYTLERTILRQAIQSTMMDMNLCVCVLQSCRLLNFIWECVPPSIYPSIHLIVCIRGLLGRALPIAVKTYTHEHTYLRDQSRSCSCERRPRQQAPASAAANLIWGMPKYGAAPCRAALPFALRRGAARRGLLVANLQNVNSDPAWLTGTWHTCSVWMCKSLLNRSVVVRLA